MSERTYTAIVVDDEDLARAVVEEHLAAHAETYRVPEQLTFAHIFFSSTQRADHAEADARAALGKIKSGAVPDANAGDPFMLSGDSHLTTRPSLLHP